MNAKPGDVTDILYKKISSNINALVTPHIAGFSDMTNTIGNDMMIANVEAWASGKPINVIE
jgi:phosphoglycerate dehydrogenase-like enzyme